MYSHTKFKPFLVQYVIAGNGPCGGNVDWTEGGGTPHCHVVQEISQMPDSTGVCGLNTESAICDLQVWGQESLVKIKLFVELLLEFSTVALNPTRMIPTHLKIMTKKSRKTIQIMVT